MQIPTDRTSGTRTERGKNFRKNIRRYNTAFSFSSFSANLQSLPGRGPRVFCMCGQIYHNYATLYPANNALPPCFNQCYIYQQSEANEFRFLNPVTGGCTPDIFEIISEVLEQVNPYAHWYKTMAEVERNERQLALQEQRPIPIITLHMKTGPERRRYNPPVHDEFAAIFSSLDGAPQLRRDIVVYPRQWRAGQVGPGGHGPTDDFDNGGAPELWGRQNHWTSKIFDSSDFSDTLASSSLHCPLVIVRIDFLILAIIRQFPLLRLCLDYL